MSTIQKAFIFIVVVLAVLTAAVNLVLFAQRANWFEKAKAVETELAKVKAEAQTAKKDLADAKESHSAKVSALEIEKNTLKTDLDAKTADLETVRADKAQLEGLAADLKAGMQILSVNVDALAQRTKELQQAKDLAEARLEEVRAAALSAEENLAISERKARDLASQTESLTQELASRDDKIDSLQKAIDIYKSYTGDIGPVVPAASKKAVFGKITGMSRDGNTAFVSVGADDGIYKDMMLLVYKADGTFVANAKVYDVSADKAAARIVAPVVGTIAEGDNVTNK